MASTTACPVPQEQRPQEEFQQLCASWFFTWPTASQRSLDQALLKSWLIIVPITTLVASGSWSLRNDPPRLLAAGADSNTVAAHRVDPKTGKLTDQRGSIVNVPSPICILFAK